MGESRGTEWSEQPRYQPWRRGRCRRPAYLKLLRKVLDARGFASTKIIAGDVHSWAPSTEVLKDPELAKVVDILCRHYPSTKSDPAAVQSGKPLWSSEDYAADNTGAGGRCQARILNQVRGILVRVFPPDLYSVLTA